MFDLFMSEVLFEGDPKNQVKCEFFPMSFVKYFPKFNQNKPRVFFSL